MHDYYLVRINSEAVGVIHVYGVDDPEIPTMHSMELIDSDGLVLHFDRKINYDPITEAQFTTYIEFGLPEFPMHGQARVSPPDMPTNPRIMTTVFRMP